METILLVDNEPAVVTLCETQLKSGGYNVLSVSNGQDALRLLQDSATSIDLALVDLMLPGMNGVELATCILAKKPAIRVVLMSECAAKAVASVVGNIPHGIIWKPFKTESLLRMIENALAEAPRRT
jgi:two-component system cell cycle sensor histidine kinase/response regulator CckA